MVKIEFLPEVPEKLQCGMIFEWNTIKSGVVRGEILSISEKGTVKVSRSNQNIPIHTTVDSWIKHIRAGEVRWITGEQGAIRETEQ